MVLDIGVGVRVDVAYGGSVCGVFGWNEYEEGGKVFKERGGGE